MRVRARARVLAATALATATVMTGLVSDAGTDSGPATRPAARSDGTTASTVHQYSGAHGVKLRPDRPPRASKPPRELTRPPQPERIGVTEAVDTVVGYTGKRTHRFHFPGAEYVKIHFSRFALVPGDKVMVSNPSGSEVHSYRSDPRVLKLPGDAPVTYDESGGFWAMSVHGDTAVVTLRSAAERLTGSPEVADLAGYGFAIDKVARGLTGEDETPAGPGNEESICGGDDKEHAACYKSDYPTEFSRSRPVARLLINGTSLCTAWRIGRNNRMLTNHHCFARAAEARRTEVWFNYECTTCGEDTIGRVSKVVGSDVLATDRGLDYTLFTVGNFESIRGFGYLELDARRADRGEEVYIPQHPNGNPKQIALHSDADLRGACRIEDPAYPGYFDGSDASYRCDTSPGSSGSPVLSRRTDKVIALHHFGGCPNSGVRADLIHRAIGDQL